MRKKIISLLSILMLLLSGCKQNNSFKIAFFIYDGNDTFIAEMIKYITERIPENVSFDVCDAGNSQSVQNQQIVELSDNGFDLFIINAVDRFACSSIVEMCTKKEIPVIFFNREPLKDSLEGSNIFYVGADADSLGKKQAEMVADLLSEAAAKKRYDRNGDGIIQLVILKGEQGHQDAEKRTDNCVNRLKELGFLTEVLAIEVADWNRLKGYESMKSLYSQYGNEIELLFSNNDDMALGAIDYLTEAGKFHVRYRGYRQSFIIVGVDGTTVGLSAIENNLLYGTVNNDSIKQADAILTLVDYITNEKSFNDFPYNITDEHYIYIDGDIITNKTIAHSTN